jgi:hypothetical protein
MLRHVDLVRTEISEESSATITTVTGIRGLGTMLVITSNRRKLRRNIETSVLTGATRRNITEDDNLHSHRRENLNYFIALTGWAL